MKIDEFIRNAVAEDVGKGDHTSNACIPDGAVGRAKIIIKEKGILAGNIIAQQIFQFIDPKIQVNTHLSDGMRVKPGDIAITISGSARSILKGERVVLNCMQRMSGIATLTNEVVDRLNGLSCKVLDTRKTTPGFRFLEKLAVFTGGGVNHRFGLYDMMMIKDNHIDYAGGIKPAILQANEYRLVNNLEVKLEIESRNLSELDQILEIGMIDRIMLDNFSFEDLREAVKRIQGRYETEASGGITIDNVREYALCGVNYISMGALTHSAKSLDISLKAY